MRCAMANKGNDIQRRKERQEDHIINRIDFKKMNSVRFDTSIRGRLMASQPAVVYRLMRFVGQV